MRKIVAYDFDGTLTTKDTLIEFIRYACGTGAFVRGFLLYAPLLVLMKLGLFPNWKAKQKVFAHFFKGLTLDAFDSLCHNFVADNRHLLRPKGVMAIQQALDKGEEVLIVSASIDNWVQPFFSRSKGAGHSGRSEGRTSDRPFPHEELLRPREGESYPRPLSQSQ